MKDKGHVGLQLATVTQSGLAVWLLKRLRNRFRSRQSQLPRLALVERITLAPRQSLSLVEAEGRRFLVATSAEGGPAFYALDRETGSALRRSSRVSW